jgi:hypothetical protein
MKRGIYLLMAVLLVASCAKDNETGQFKADQELNDYTALLETSEEFQELNSTLVEMAAEEAIALEALARLQEQSNAVPTDEPFVFFVIGDTELNMRGNTYPQLEAFFHKINDIESLDLEFTSGDFEAGESMTITKPELVLLAGDICKDRAFGFSLPGDENNVTNRDIRLLFNEMDQDILFFPGNGNHDWDPYQWGDDGYGHNLGGLLSNVGTANFVRSEYTQSLNRTDLVSGTSFNYDKNSTWFPLTSSAEFNYSLTYKGVRFTQLNQFLHVPVAMVSFESLFGTGPAWYYPNRSSNWFQELCDESAEQDVPHVVVQHFPINTGDGWWNDNLGGTPDQLRKSFMDIFEDSHQPMMFSGHNHSYRKTTVQPYEVEDHTAGYFASGYVIAVKASATKGIYAITHVDLENLVTRDPSTLATTFTIPQ